VNDIHRLGLAALIGLLEQDVGGLSLVACALEQAVTRVDAEERLAAAGGAHDEYWDRAAFGFVRAEH